MSDSDASDSSTSVSDLRVYTVSRSSSSSSSSITSVRRAVPSAATVDNQPPPNRIRMTPFAFTLPSSVVTTCPGSITPMSSESWSNPARTFDCAITQYFAAGVMASSSQLSPPVLNSVSSSSSSNSEALSSTSSCPSSPSAANRAVPSLDAMLTHPFSHFTLKIPASVSLPSSTWITSPGSRIPLSADVCANCARTSAGCLTIYFDAV